MSKIVFKNSTDEDFRKYQDYLQKEGKTDGHPYQRYEITGITNSFKRSLKKQLMNIRKHIDSIFPKEYEYSYREFKMLVDKTHHYILFYRVDKDSNGEEILKVHKCIHSTELRKDLEERGIKPRKGCDQSLLKELESVYKEDDIRDEKEKELEKYSDKEVQTKEGPRGGVYFRTIDPKTHHVGVWRSIKESKEEETKHISIAHHLRKRLISLVEYLRS